MGFFVQPLGIPLPGEHQHRGTIHVGVGHACDQIGGSRAQRAEGSGRITGQTPVNFGHKGSTLFVPAENELDLVRLLKRHHEVSIFFARHPEDVLDTFCFQTPYKQV